MHAYALPLLQLTAATAVERRRGRPLACDDGLHSVLPYRAQVTVAHKELGWVLFEPVPPEGAEAHVHDLRLPAGRAGAQCALPIEPASLTSRSLFAGFVISATVAYIQFIYMYKSCHCR